MHRHVESACGGYVPRATDTAELAGWSDEGAPPENVLAGLRGKLDLLPPLK